jgi:hypothetical protein
VQKGNSKSLKRKNDTAIDDLPSFGGKGRSKSVHGVDGSEKIERRVKKLQKVCVFLLKEECCRVYF